MKVTITQDTKWIRALNAARRTIGLPMKPEDYKPSDKWKKMVLMAEHSPIKLVEYCISFEELRQWVGIHLLRHDYTIPMIHSQRGDRRNLNEEYPYLEKVMQIIKEDLNNPNLVPRDCVIQGQTNDQDFYVNCQTLINISRKRLCNCASKETKEAWVAVKDAIAEVDPIMAMFMVPNCVYRGFCPEMECCGFYKTKLFDKQVKEYRALIGR